VEVIAIDEKAGSVRVKNHGTLQTLDFANNGVKLPSASSLPKLPGVGAPPAQPMGLQSSLGGPPGGRGMGMRQIPTRPVRMNTTSDGDQGTGGNGQSFGQNTTGGMGTPMTGGSPAYGGVSAGIGTRQGNPNQGGVGFARTPDYGLSADQQSVLIEAHREQLMQQGNTEEASMLPPTDLTQ